ncbi:hypothetical protein LOC67_21160 [Stieleria sp. JC731]|uniref:hypothetical protein n=1 Tax=Pirellulaceae TaxID=2691357 RepID=UPI001E357CDB|nr:hypothetical protein [Stieleria sp. JC731]MCC9603066.1 hypothetical protein [Stieleria sp. JC731]
MKRNCVSQLSARDELKRMKPKRVAFGPSSALKSNAALFFIAVSSVLATSNASAQVLSVRQSHQSRQPQPISNTVNPATANSSTLSSAASNVGPTKDVTYQLVLLIESDDENRLPYDGPARSGLSKAGFGRLVQAGSATSMITIGQRSTVSGTSRYGQLSMMSTLLNTTEKNQLQIQIQLKYQNQSPLTIEATARVPVGRWVLVGAAESRSGLPKDASDGRRVVAILKVDDGVMTLD